MRNKWQVVQDGAYFYVTVNDQTEPDVYKYPWVVDDWNLNVATDARSWFMIEIVPFGVEVEFSL